MRSRIIIKSDPQLVHIAYLIFMKTKVYHEALKTWNAKAAVDKKFANIQIHFRQEYHDLKKVGELTVEESSLNLLRQLKTQQEEIAADMLENFNQNNSADLAQTFHPMQLPLLDENTTPAQMHAMRTKDDKLLKYLENLQNQVSIL